MCGIAGYYFLNGNRPAGDQLLHTMCDSMAHRGPDEEGYYVDGAFGMGMRRLSIIDLSGGQQPMSNEDESKHIVFNGEIYNYREIHKELVARGHEFKTASDTECILHLYEDRGADCVHALNGMFTISIWDSRTKTLFLARDRMGVKPLYYYWDGKTFLYASEIKAIAASGLVDLEINPQALWDFLTFRYVPQPQTVWKNIYKLPPAHTLFFRQDGKGPVISRYWDIPYDDNAEEKSPEEYIAEFEQLFLSAVGYRLIADVPVGILLSGGLDSSAVAAAISETHNAGLNSFSVAFSDSPETNELEFARMVSQHTGTIHHEVVIGKREFLDFLPEFVRYADEPLADLASIPLYYVSRLARQNGIKVVLSGEGSDEVLAGYGFERTQQMWNSFRRAQGLPAPMRKATSLLAAPLVGDKWKDKLSWLNMPEGEWLRTTPFNMTHFFSHNQQRALFSGFTGAPSAAGLLEQTRQAPTRVPLHQALYSYAQSWLVEDLLMKADKMTMATSVELRVPFLDYRLVEWAARTPTWVKVGGGPAGKYESKWVLRRFAETRLPRQIIGRPKRGFPVPVYDWLQNDIKEWAFSTLGANAKIYDWLDRTEVKKYLRRGTETSATVTDRHRLWHLLILELWLQEWQKT
jgi:asparagine synthase (glutamine-hydrolysing)